MSLKKRAVEGIVVASTLVMMTAIAQTANTVEVEAAAVAVETRTDLATNGTAGVVVQLDQVEVAALESVRTLTADIEQTRAAMVATAAVQEEVPVQEVALTEEQMLWQNRLMADVQEFLYVRAAGDENAEIVGKLYKGDVAEIVEYGDVWTYRIR